MTASTISRRCTASAIATRRTEHPRIRPPRCRLRGSAVFQSVSARRAPEQATEIGRLGIQNARQTADRRRFRFGSPLLRRILLVNALPLALLVAALLYLDQYQNGLLEAEVGALREQARIYAGALGESAVKEENGDNPKLVPELARPLLRRLTDPTP